MKLCSQMELQMKAICEGSKTKTEVVQQSLEQYREVFARATQQISVLKSVRTLQCPSLPFLLDPTSSRQRLEVHIRLIQLHYSPSAGTSSHSRMAEIDLVSLRENISRIEQTGVPIYRELNRPESLSIDNCRIPQYRQMLR